MVNKAILIGNLGHTPKIMRFDSGKVKATFPLATSETYKNKEGEKISKVEWHNCVVWGNLASIVESYINKGDKIYVEGKIRTRSYEGNDNIKKYITEINVDIIQMLGSKSTNNNNAAPQDQVEEHGVGTIDETDNLPF